MKLSSLLVFFLQDNIIKSRQPEFTDILLACTITGVPLFSLLCRANPIKPCGLKVLLFYFCIIADQAGISKISHEVHEEGICRVRNGWWWS